MVKSNTVTINVLPKAEKPSITGVSLTANKTSVYVGETVSLEYIIHFNKSITNEQANKYQVKITVLVNNTPTKTFYTQLIPGTDYIDNDFSLSFAKEGTYNVQIDTDIVEKQYSW